MISAERGVREPFEMPAVLWQFVAIKASDLPGVPDLSHWGSNVSIARSLLKLKLVPSGEYRKDSELFVLVRGPQGPD